jgi:hypothetical protein
MTPGDDLHEVGRPGGVRLEDRGALEPRGQERQVRPVDGVRGARRDARLDLAVEERAQEAEPARRLDPLRAHDVHHGGRGPALRDRHLDEAALARLQAERVEAALHLLAVGVGAHGGLEPQLPQVARAHDVAHREPPVRDEEPQPIGGPAAHVEHDEMLEPLLLVARRDLRDDDRLDLLLGRLERDGQGGGDGRLPRERVGRPRAGRVGALPLEPRGRQALPARDRARERLDVGQREEHELPAIGLGALERDARQRDAVVHARETALEDDRDRAVAFEQVREPHEQSAGLPLPVEPPRLEAGGAAAADRVDAGREGELPRARWGVHHALDRRPHARRRRCSNVSTSRRHRALGAHRQRGGPGG